MFKDFSLVVGVDSAHLDQLAFSWQSWKENKPSLLKRPVIFFYDRAQISAVDIINRLQPRKSQNLTYVPWPQENDLIFAGSTASKWTNPQRYKMLSGFVHVPAIAVKTKYWLKLDTDVVAEQNDDWIKDEWFKFNPAIIAPAWGYTKPANQMLVLDEWADLNGQTLDGPTQLLAQQRPLNLYPEDGANKVKHKRIISYVGFFNTTFTRLASQMAHQSCGQDMLPVPSQDGYVWYVAARLGCGIVNFNAKRLGFSWNNGLNATRASAIKATNN